MKQPKGQTDKEKMEQALEAPIYELFWHAGMLSSLKNVKTDATGFYYFCYTASWER